MSKLSIVGALAVATLAAACSSKSDSNAGAAPVATAAPTVAPTGGGDPTAKATEIFATRCTPCHGAMGKGDGAASASLVPPPRNFTDPAWQTSVTDEHIEKIIKFGGAAVGKAPTMPGNPDLNDPAVIAALRAHVRSLNGK